MADTPRASFTAIKTMLPETRVAIPAIMLCGIAWFALDTVRQRDHERINGALALQDSKISQAVQSANEARLIADDLKLRQTKSDVAQEYVARALIDLKVDVKTIAADVQVLIKNRP